MIMLCSSSTSDSRLFFTNRGLAVIYMLKQIENLTNRRIMDSFDLICGVSTGAIMIGCLCKLNFCQKNSTYRVNHFSILRSIHDSFFFSVPPVNMTLEQIENCYNDLSTKVFNQSTIVGTSKMLWSHGYYDTEVWEKLLKSYVGDTKLIDSAKFSHCPKVSAMNTTCSKLGVKKFFL